MHLCTIAIPVFNRQNFVSRAIESALDQRVESLEILVVDNCSTDGTREVVQRYRDPRLRLVRNETNVGLFGNFNRCLQLSCGRYLRVLCSDDRLAPDCLDDEIRIMESHPRVSLLTTRGHRIDPGGRALGPCADHFPAGLYQGEEGLYAALCLMTHYAANPFNYPSGVLLRRSMALEAGEFDTGMAMAGDVDFYLRLLLRGDLAVLDRIGCEVTIHGEQESTVLEGDTRCLSELCEITARHRDLVERGGNYRRLQHQLAAYALGLAFKHWRRGQTAAFQAHWALACQQGASTLQTAQAVARLLTLRLLFKTVGVRWAPVRALPLNTSRASGYVNGHITQC